MWKSIADAFDSSRLRGEQWKDNENFHHKSKQLLGDEFATGYSRSYGQNKQT